MHRHLRRLLTTSVALPVAGVGFATVGGGTAAAAQNGAAAAALLTTSLAPSVPYDPAIFTVAPGGVPWKITQGHVTLSQSGTLLVTVTGLIDPTLSPPHNPVSYIAASVYCNATLSMTTPPVPFSSQGDARIQAAVTLPSFCPAPAVLLNPAKGATSTDVLPVYIAFNGTTTSIVGAFQEAPSPTAFTYEANVYTPIATYAQTVQDFSSGQGVYLKTTQSGQPYQLTSASQYERIEHTGTHNFAQYTSYTKS